MKKMGDYCCPACGAENVANQSTCRCGADLLLLQKLDAVADAWFNRALEALADGAPAQALEWLSASCAARPTDAAIRRTQAKVWAQLGKWEAAQDALDRAAVIDPDAPEVVEIQAALLDARKYLQHEIFARQATMIQALLGLGVVTLVISFLVFLIGIKKKTIRNWAFFLHNQSKGET